MKNWKQILISIITIIIIAAGFAYYYVFVYSKGKGHDVSNKTGIEITAIQIVKEYQSSDSTANAKYLNKIIEVTGKVIESKLNQDSLLTITLQSADMMSNVFCTLKKGISPPPSESTITIKGICAGYLSDVILNDAIITKK
jgi:hypothetical protein